MGKLHHVVIILPGTNNFNKALKLDPIIIGLDKRSNVRALLLNLVAIVVLLTDRPKNIKELIPN